MFPAIRIFILGLICGVCLSLLFSLSSMKFNEYFFNEISSRIEGNTVEFRVGILNTTDLLDEEYKDQEVARELARAVKLLCWVATTPDNLQTKAKHIRDTWGRRCNILLFMSSEPDDSLPVVVLDVEESREHLFDKTKAAMIYVYNHYLDDLDWVLKADDDTYVVVENLRLLLSQYNPSEAFYLGCRFKPFTRQGFMSGGAGYVLSRTALKLLVEESIPNKEKCLQSGTGEGEDVQMGKCLENVNVTAVDTRDVSGKGRFFPYHPEFHLFPDHNSQVYSWYWAYQYYADNEGFECCSDSAVSFHYISPDQLQLLDFLIYKLRPYGSSLYYRRQQKKIVISL